jgi:protein O-mannosyl-transferase
MRREAIICLGLAAITVALFWPVNRHDFINFDDRDYVTENPTVRAGITWPGVRWAFGGSHASNWHPLTWLSHMLDCQVFGLKPGAHHLVSLGFHIASTLLLFLALNQMTRAAWRSALVAALFAWHPLRVESVAWVAERKDVLSAFFFMLTLWAYGRYGAVQSLKSKVQSREAGAVSQHAESRSPQHATRTTQHTTRFYLLALFFFALGLLCKPMLVTLPFVLLLLDYWPLRRFELKTLDFRLKTLVPLLREKAPFFALALAVGIVTLLAQQAAAQSLEQWPLGSRLANALAAYSAYLGKMVWPRNLSVFYPHAPIPAWQMALSAILLTCLTVLCVRQARSRPWLLVGWTWFGVMLLPVIGLVQVGWQSMADRYTYLPLIGVFIMLVWGAVDLRPCSRTGRLLLRLGAVLVLGACLAATRFQLKYWQDSLALFRRALEVMPDNWLAHNNLGTALADEGKVDKSAEHFRAAVQLNPACDDARNNLGRYLAERGQQDEAKTQIEAVLRRNPRHAGAHRNLGYVLFTEGNIADGVSQYALARQLRPDDAATPEDLAALLTKQAESPTTLPYLRQALDLLPTAEMRAQAASTWAGQGKLQYAVQGYRAALALEPQSPDILNNLAWLMATCPEANLRDGAEAVRLAQQACELTGFRRTLMVGTLAAAYAEAGQFVEAVTTAQKACALAAESGDEALAGKNQELLQLYRAGHPYHETTNAAPAVPAAPKP